jgi:hypothetical protein
MLLLRCCGALRSVVLYYVKKIANDAMFMRCSYPCVGNAGCALPFYVFHVFKYPCKKWGLSDVRQTGALPLKKSGVSVEIVTFVIKIFFTYIRECM